MTRDGKLGKESLNSGYHILYTARSGDFVTVEKEFSSFAAVKDWLRSIGATYWEIGLPDGKISFYGGEQ